MTRMKHRVRGAEQEDQRPKEEEACIPTLFRVENCTTISNRIRESILVWHRTLWHNGQFELQTVLTCLTRSFEVVCTGTTGFSNSEIGFRPRQKRSSFCSSFLPTESTVLENHLCITYCFACIIVIICTWFEQRVRKSIKNVYKNSA